MPTDNHTKSKKTYLVNLKHKLKKHLQQQPTSKDTERTDFTPIRPQPPLPNQQDSGEKR
jgi:hypothetical protein